MNIWGCWTVPLSHCLSSRELKNIKTVHFICWSGITGWITYTTWARPFVLWNFAKFHAFWVIAELTKITLQNFPSLSANCAFINAISKEASTSIKSHLSQRWICKGLHFYLNYFRKFVKELWKSNRMPMSWFICNEWIGFNKDILLPVREFYFDRRGEVS